MAVGVCSVPLIFCSDLLFRPTTYNDCQAIMAKNIDDDQTETQEIWIRGKNFSKQCKVKFREFDQNSREIWSKDAQIDSDQSDRVSTAYKFLCCISCSNYGVHFLEHDHGVHPAVSETKHPHADQMRADRLGIGATSKSRSTVLLPSRGHAHGAQSFRRRWWWSR